jgi:hypothetical protein
MIPGSVQAGRLIKLRRRAEPYGDFYRNALAGRGLPVAAEDRNEKEHRKDVNVERRYHGGR